MFGLVELGFGWIWFGLVGEVGGGGSNHKLFLCLSFSLVNPRLHTEN